MRRRRSPRWGTLTAEELSGVYSAAWDANRDDPAAVCEALAEYGYDAVDAIRARLWLRRGKPASYRWEHFNDARPMRQWKKRQVG